MQPEEKTVYLAGSRALRYHTTEDNRPREKALKHGLSALSDAELLALIVRGGSVGESVVDLCQRMLLAYDGKFALMGRQSVNDLTKFRGIGKVKAIELLATLEIGRRYMKQNIGDRPQIKSSQDAYNYLCTELNHLEHEEIWILLLNRAKQVIKSVKVSQGGTAATVGDIKIILKEAITNLADSIILAHNHPSDNAMPSSQDDVLTRRVKEGCRAVDIPLVDHLIVCRDNKFYSYCDHGRL